MSVSVNLKNDKTGEIKQVKVGWSWILFLFSGFLGIPLFLRKLYPLASLFVALWVCNFALATFVPDDAIGLGILQFIFLGLAIWLGIKGNEMTGKNYLENGYSWQDPESDEVIEAKRRWSIE